MTLTIAANHVVTGRGVAHDTRVTVGDGMIVDVTSARQRGEAAADVVGAWVLPGAIDLHCHGGGGASLMSSDLDQVLAALAFHRAHGTTTSLVSLVSAPVERLCRQLERLADWFADPTTGLAGYAAGVHLEGPFLSTVRCGAIDPATMIDATPDAMAALIAAAHGWLRVITVAPERPGVLEAIPALRAAGVVVAVGHTDAPGEVVHRAIAAGATLATHLGNGMPPFHHREPGPFGACLTDEAVSCELIADGHHLHPDTVRLAIAAKGDGRVTLCTDAVAAAGAEDGSYRLGDQTVTVADGVVRLDRTGALAGSTLTMDLAVANTSRWRLDPVTVARAIATNPARVIGLDDRGTIGVGQRGDLCVFDAGWSLVAVVASGELLRV